MSVSVQQACCSEMTMSTRCVFCLWLLVLVQVLLTPAFEPSPVSAQPGTCPCSADRLCQCPDDPACQCVTLEDGLFACECKGIVECTCERCPMCPAPPPPPSIPWCDCLDGSCQCLLDGSNCTCGIVGEDLYGCTCSDGAAQCVCPLECRDCPPPPPPPPPPSPPPPCPCSDRFCQCPLDCKCVPVSEDPVVTGCECGGNITCLCPEECLSCDPPPPPLPLCGCSDDGTCQCPCNCITTDDKVDACLSCNGTVSCYCPDECARCPPPPPPPEVPPILPPCGCSPDGFCQCSFDSCNCSTHYENVTGCVFCNGALSCACPDKCSKCPVPTRCGCSDSLVCECPEGCSCGRGAPGICVDATDSPCCECPAELGCPNCLAS